MKIVTGIVKEPHLVVIYGTPGIGKTTFAVEAPNPIIADIEGGSKKYKTSRVTDFTCYEDLLKLVTHLRNENHNYKTFALDTLDHIEPMIFDHVCKLDGNKKSIEDVGGGFQKGYVFAMEIWRDLIDSLKDLRKNRDMNIIAIAHAKVTTVNDPLQPLPYDRYTLKLHENKQVSASALWREVADAVLFATFEDTVFKVNSKDKKAKASGDGVRKLYTTRTAAWDGKNRLGLPSELPFSLGSTWEEFSRAADLSEPDSLEQVNRDIDAHLEFFKSKDASVAERIEKARVAVNGDLEKLIGIRNGARILEAQAS